MAEEKSAGLSLDVIGSNPYEEGKPGLIALRLPEMLEPDESQWLTPTTREFLAYGDALWAAMRSVLEFWTPGRLEKEALRRASADSGTLIIAEEVAILTVAYHKWQTKVIEILSLWTHFGANRLASEKTRMVLAGMTETLNALDRRVHAAESRSTDLRLRYEFHQLRQELARRELTSHIVTAIREAAKNPESDQHLKSIVEKLSGLEDRFARFHGELEFIADHTTRELIESGAFDAAERKAVKALAKAGLTEWVKLVFEKIAQGSLPGL